MNSLLRQVNNHLFLLCTPHPVLLPQGEKGLQISCMKKEEDSCKGGYATLYVG